MRSPVGPQLRDDGTFQVPVDGYYRLVNNAGRVWYFSGNNPQAAYTLNNVKVTLPANAVNVSLANPNNADQAPGVLADAAAFAFPRVRAVGRRVAAGRPRPARGGICPPPARGVRLDADATSRAADLSRPDGNGSAPAAALTRPGAGPGR